MSIEQRHFVEFMSPGTLFDEVSEREIASWDPKVAAEMAKTVEERYGARPYGFRFLTKTVGGSIPDDRGGELQVQPRVDASSGVYYLDGTLRRLSDVEAENKDEEKILRANMRGNRLWIVCQTTNGYRHTGEFAEQDYIVDHEGSVVERGNDPKHVEYRRRCEAESLRDRA